MKDIKTRFINESQSKTVKLSKVDFDMLLETFNYSKEIFNSYLKDHSKYGGKDFDASEYEKLADKLFDAIDEVESNRKEAYSITFSQI